MTVAEAVKDSKSGGLFNRALIEYGQSQLREDEDLVCAAIVYVTRRAADRDGAQSGYLARAGVSSKIKMLLCVTTRRCFSTICSIVLLRTSCRWTHCLFLMPPAAKLATAWEICVSPAAAMSISLRQTANSQTT